MKKKGFTLIELLAVIIILAIIALIAVPIVINLIEKSRRSAFEDSVYGVIKAGELYYAESVMDDEGFNGETIHFETASEVSKLNLKGTAPTKGWMTINGNGNISLSVTNGKYTADKAATQSKLTITDGDNVSEASSGPKKLGDISVSQLGVTRPSCSDSGTCTVGTAFALEVGPSIYKKFYVIADDGSKVTLILSENLGSSPWCTEEDFIEAGGTTEGFNSMGVDGMEDEVNYVNTKIPYTLVKYFDTSMATWTNITKKDYNIYEPGIPSQLVARSTYTINSKARVITYTEAKDLGCDINNYEESLYGCPTYLTEGLNDGEYYWTASLYVGNTKAPWYIGYMIHRYWSENEVFVRPVIELNR